MSEVEEDSDYLPGETGPGLPVGELMEEPETGEIRVWNGSSWLKLGPVLGGGDPEPVPLSSGGWVTGRMPSPIRWRSPSRPIGGMSPTVEGAGADDVPYEDPDQTDLRAALPCSICGLTLLDPVCSPKHAYWADHPEEHPLLKPLVDRALKADRISDRECRTDGKTLGRDGCVHADLRRDQVRMSRVVWMAMIDELRRLREEKKAVDEYLSGESAGSGAARARPRGAPSSDPS